jgi:thiol-disulfide isomerase/thioredoxin
MVSGFPALARTGVESALHSWCGACESMAHLAQEVSRVLDQYVHELRASPLAFVVIDDAGTRPPVTSPERRKQAA